MLTASLLTLTLLSQGDKVLATNDVPLLLPGAAYAALMTDPTPVPQDNEDFDEKRTYTIDGYTFTAVPERTIPPIADKWLKETVNGSPAYSVNILGNGGTFSYNIYAHQPGVNREDSTAKTEIESIVTPRRYRAAFGRRRASSVPTQKRNPKSLGSELEFTAIYSLNSIDNPVVIIKAIKGDVLVFLIDDPEGEPERVVEGKSREFPIN